MSSIPFALPKNCDVLVAGAGGGFDCICGLPIVLELESRGHFVHIANYSFTNFKEIKNAVWHSKNLIEITADSKLDRDNYFPEFHLSNWYRQKFKVEKSVWGFTKDGVKPTLESYKYLINKFDIKAVICIDGGVDGIFRGDEFDLGTPSMDSILVISTHLSNAPIRLYACTAFGTEGAEGKVSHAQALNRMADLIAQNAFLGVGTIRQDNNNGADFIEAISFIYSQLSPLEESIIVNTILAAIKGNYGKQNVHPKTQTSQPWISPLTSLIWYFKADEVAKMKLFYEAAKNSISVGEVADAIENVRRKVGIKPFESIPI